MNYLVAVAEISGLSENPKLIFALEDNPISQIKQSDGLSILPSADSKVPEAKPECMRIKIYGANDYAFAHIRDAFSRTADVRLFS